MLRTMLDMACSVDSNSYGESSLWKIIDLSLTLIISFVER